MSLLRYFEFCQSRAFQMKLSYKNLEKKLELFLRVGSLRLKAVIKSVGAADFSRRLSVTEVAAAALQVLVPLSVCTLPLPLRLRASM